MIQAILSSTMDFIAFASSTFHFFVLLTTTSWLLSVFIRHRTSDNTSDEISDSESTSVSSSPSETVEVSGEDLSAIDVSPFQSGAIIDVESTATSSSTVGNSDEGFLSNELSSTSLLSSIPPTTEEVKEPCSLPPALESAQQQNVDNIVGNNLFVDSGNAVPTPTPAPMPSSTSRRVSFTIVTTKYVDISLHIPPSIASFVLPFKTFGPNQKSSFSRFPLMLGGRWSQTQKETKTAKPSNHQVASWSRRPLQPLLALKRSWKLVSSTTPNLFQVTLFQTFGNTCQPLKVNNSEVFIGCFTTLIPFIPNTGTMRASLVEPLTRNYENGISSAQSAFKYSWQRGLSLFTSPSVRTPLQGSQEDADNHAEANVGAAVGAVAALVSFGVGWLMPL